MIPKIIHYVWVNDNPFPDKIKRCLESWRKYLPDYEFVKWDYNKVKNINNPFHHEAIKVGKLAFAADFIRLYALYHFGGIYLDTDVQVLKSFDDLLENQCFLGREKWLQIHDDLQEFYPTSHCIGSIQGHSFIKHCLDYYSGRHFIRTESTNIPENLQLDMTIIPYVLNEILKLYGYDSRPSQNNKILHLKNGVMVYPYEYFDCKEIKPESYCKHWCMSSWRSSEVNIINTNKSRWQLRKDIIVRRILNKMGYITMPKQ